MARPAIREAGATDSRRRARRARRAVLAALAVLATVPFVGPAQAARGPSATLEQCENGKAATPKACEWITGNLGPHNSHWAENESVPYRLRLDNLSTGGTHTVTVEWDPTKNGKHAFDYLTTFNRTEATADPCLGVTGCTLASFSTAAVPTDADVTGAGVTQIPGLFTIWNGAFTGVSSYTTSGSYSGDSSTRITLTFTAGAANPVIAWSAHIASDLAWGANAAASTIAGSPYHVRLQEIDGFGGNQDRSMKVAPGPVPGSITIVKQAGTEGPRPFSFTASDQRGNFTLVDDGDDGAAPFHAMTFDGLTDFYTPTNGSTYDFTEAVPVGWALSSISCSPAAVVTTDLATATVKVGLSEDTHVTCTFANANLVPTIAVTKTATPATLPEPGGRVTFVVDVDNTSTEPVTLDSLVDSVYGDLADGTNPKLVASTCAVGAATTIAAGDDYTCSFTVEVVGNARFTETDTVEAEVHDADGATAVATGDATVTVTDALPSIAVDKTASKAVVRPGEAVTYTYVVTTPGAEPLLQVEVSDDKCSPVGFVSGDAGGDGRLDPGESWTYTCAATLTAATTNTATAEAVDDEGNAASATDRVTVEVVDPGPAGPVPDGDAHRVTSVLGTVVERPRAAPAVGVTDLPRTGQDVGALALAGAALVALGSVLLAWAPRPRRRTG